YSYFFFNDTATTEIYTLSLHDALPICFRGRHHGSLQDHMSARAREDITGTDRKSTRLNSSHSSISYAVFCLQKTESTTFLPPLTVRYSPLTRDVRRVEVR